MIRIRPPCTCCAFGSAFRTVFSTAPFDLVSSLSTGHPMTLSDWRRRIDEIDRKLVELLNERSHCALEIGKLKQAAKIFRSISRTARSEVLQNAERNNPGPLTDAAIRRLFERIIDEARAAERDAMHSDDAEKGENETFSGSHVVTCDRCFDYWLCRRRASARHFACRIGQTKGTGPAPWSSSCKKAPPTPRSSTSSTA